jgi:3,4-dihydroxyphenylacetate 2,3-dioxygenase
MAFSITRAGHIEFRVTDLERARHFYVDVLGFIKNDQDDQRLYLGGLEEREHHGLVLRLADTPGVSHLAFRVSEPADLERLETLYRDNGRPIRWMPAGFEKGQGPALRVQDPTGLPLEFYHQMESREWMLQRFDRYRGANVMRMDHFNVQVPEVQKAYDWFTKTLGFRCSELTVTEDDPPQLWAAWLHHKQNVHDIAVMNGIGPRLHHAGFWLANQDSVLRACDVLAASGYADSIERGPGRHGISNAFFVYLRDPDGNRVELYTNDYMIPDPDWEPIRWGINDPRRATFWGHKPPSSWFDEAALVESIETGQLQPTWPPPLRDRPEFVT